MISNVRSSEVYGPVIGSQKSDEIGLRAESSSRLSSRCEQRVNPVKDEGHASAAYLLAG